MTPRPRLVLVADVPSLGEPLVLRVLSRALPAAEPGAVAVIDRDRPADLGGTPDRGRLARLEALRSLTARHGALLWVTGRPDLATVVGADGVQLPESGLSVTAVREAFPDLPIGRSCHDRVGLETARRAGARWALLGPVWSPRSKAASGPTLGPEGLAALARGLDWPIYALGGVGPDNARQLAHCGLAGLATVGAVFAAEAPEDVVRVLSRALVPAPERAVEVG